MNEERKNEDLKKASDEDLERELENRMEKRWEERGEKIERKIDKAVGRLPRWLNSLLDAACITVVILIAAWIIAKLGWIAGMPSWRTFGIVFGSLFVLSLLYRYLIKPGCGCGCGKR